MVFLLISADKLGSPLTSTWTWPVCICQTRLDSTGFHERALCHCPMRPASSVHPPRSQSRRRVLGWLLSPKANLDLTLKLDPSAVRCCHLNHRDQRRDGPRIHSHLSPKNLPPHPRSSEAEKSTSAKVDAHPLPNITFPLFRSYIIIISNHETLATSRRAIAIIFVDCSCILCISSGSQLFAHGVTY